MANIFLLPILFLVIFLLLAAFKRPKRLQHRPIPSPPTWPIIGNLHQLGELQHQSLWNLSKKYGPVMLLKLGKVPTVILSSSETARQALRDNDLNCCSRPPLAGARELSYNNKDMSFSPYNDYWKELRKLCARELFSAKQIHSFQPIKDEEIKKVIAQISESASLKNPVNLTKTFLALTVSVVCKAAFGVSFEGTVLSNDRFNKLVRDAFETLGSFSATDFIPHVGWIIDQFTGLQKMREKSVRDLDAFYEQLFDLHKEGDRQGREDFVDMLLRFEKEGTVVGTDNLTRNHIKAILMLRICPSMQSSLHREKPSSIAMILETHRNIEFPHRIVDKRPRKRPRLAWDAAPPPPPPPPTVFHPPLYYGQEFASGVAPSFVYPNMFYNGFPRQGSPPWRPDDKDGHFVFVVGDSLTPRYQILSKMGEGTFGQVLECFDNKNKEAVAIKVIRSVNKYREAAMIEIDVLQRLTRHDVGGSRCVQIRNWFDYRNHICIVFEKLGPSLYDFLRKNSYRSFPIDLVRELGRQLLESVAYMHDLRLIHTDLKPENILLVSSEYIKIPDYKFISRPTKDGSYFKNLPKSSAIKLIDFGSTTFEHQDHNYIVSTRHYRAPEVILGVGWNYPCDLWSIGCILVELCSGEALFQTHENLEHLAMMERVLGPLPPHMVLRADRRSERYFRRGAKLDWPEGATSRDSLKAVWKLPRLPNLIMQHVDHSAGDLIDLLQGLLRYDPAVRLKAREALNHPFFTRSREQSIPFNPNPGPFLYNHKN